jgi:glycosyltransferase involved in cell wall biosynthesis
MPGLLIARPSMAANNDSMRPSVRLFYHVFYPSDNVSARHYADLTRGLHDRGWDVSVSAANRDYPDGSRTYPIRENWSGVKIRRVWRPNWNQSRNFGRLGNAAWMIAAWSLRALKLWDRPDVVIIGTDPILSVLAAIPWRLSGVKVVHWGFDIYPECAIADGMLCKRSMLVRSIEVALSWAYRSCHLIADIGPCMRELLKPYVHTVHMETLTPWALVEPESTIDPDPGVRQELFGDAALGLLYSGTFGRAHSYEELLALARQMRNDSVAFCFAGRGNRADQLKAAITSEDANIRIAGFAAESELEKRLGAADVHLASLQPEWTGTVVPSKFFGSLAIGRPVVFAGSPEAAISRWVKQYDVGWLLTKDNIPDVASELRKLAADRVKLRHMQERCQRVYREHFSRHHVVDEWDRQLRGLFKASSNNHRNDQSTRTSCGSC